LATSLSALRRQAVYFCIEVVLGVGATGEGAVRVWVPFDVLDPLPDF
jgi:hypothetical protein